MPTQLLTIAQIIRKQVSQVSVMRLTNGDVFAMLCDKYAGTQLNRAAVGLIEARGGKNWRR